MPLVLHHLLSIILFLSPKVCSFDSLIQVAVQYIILFISISNKPTHSFPQRLPMPLIQASCLIIVHKSLTTIIIIIGYCITLTNWTPSAPMVAQPQHSLWLCTGALCVPGSTVPKWCWTPQCWRWIWRLCYNCSTQRHMSIFHDYYPWLRHFPLLLHNLVFSTIFLLLWKPVFSLNFQRIPFTATPLNYAF
jgi:hypothetical protein